MSFNISLSVGYFTQTPMFKLGDPSSTMVPTRQTRVSKDIDVTVYPTWYKHVVVEWKVPADWGNCVFNVYFSPNENGPYTRINDVPVDGNNLRNTGTQEYSKVKKTFYIVEAVLLDQGNGKLQSPPETWESIQNDWVKLRSREIQRREYLLLTKFTGSKTYIFRRKTYGQRCPECWNLNVEKVMKDNCKTCLGTSFKGGYFECIPTYLQYDPSPDSSVKTYFGKFEPNQTPAWTVSVPEIFPDDIVIRQGKWDLHRVENVSYTELQGVTVRQMIQLTELDKNSIEYQLLKQVPDFPIAYT